MKTNLERYNELQSKLKNLRYACFIISFDNYTICPIKDKENSYNVMNYFEKQILDITTSDEYYNLLLSLLQDLDNKDDVLYKIIKHDFKELDKIKNIPTSLLLKGNEIQGRTHLSWEIGRKNLDFTEFEKAMEELVDYQKEYVSKIKTNYSGYDALLDEMEDDFTIEKYDEFFSLLEEKVLPVLKKKLKEKKKYNESIKDVKFPIHKQKQLSQKICEIMGYSLDVGYLGETIHPFSSGGNINDVRITTRYDESLLFSNLYSVMHEVGHALYTLQHDESLNESSLMHGASCATHESQSRFYENYLGRSKPFIEFLYPILKDIFKEELKEYTFDDIYEYINDVSSQPTRTEADELSYPFHVLIRYKVEKKVFNNEIKVTEIEEYFNSLMKEYLDITPTNKKTGCFQDIHWCGTFGYFPTYALGSAIGAQIYDTLTNDLDVSALLRKGSFKEINAWLKENVHQYGGTLKNLEIIKNCCGKDFDPTYYVNYLLNKFN